ncbi:hypothetical protein HDU98_010686 [Podochytrium sp. JEL0797]|nr:hypothetical protein HDU98_010686 [Podochytrium sp. JEL0797]
MNATLATAEPDWYKYAGVSLALSSGLFIGCAFIFKKKGLIDTKSLHGELGNGHQYLNSPMWWTGMILMALGEVSNFVAYAFSPAILVTPLGAISVVVSAILSEIFLKEKLNLSGKIGCAQCVIGAILIVLHAPESNSSDTIGEFFGFVGTPLFITYASLCGAGIVYLVYKVAPEHGDKNPMVYISICSLVGSFLVLSCQGFGSAVAFTFAHFHDGGNQFLDWRIYPLMCVIAATVVMQIHFLNKALNQFSTAIVTPVYYVTFTTCTIISSAVLFRGFTVNSSTDGATIILGFTVIVGGVSLLFDYNDRMVRHRVRMQSAKVIGANGQALVSKGESFMSEFDESEPDKKDEVVLQMEAVNRSREGSGVPLKSAAL